MDGLRFTVALHFGGTLAANQQGVVCLPCPATLVEVSACASNASGAKLQVGAGASATGIKTQTAIGQSSVPTVWKRGDFDGALVTGKLWHGAKGDLLTWLLNYNGGAGVAGIDVDVLLTFVEG